MSVQTQEIAWSDDLSVGNKKLDGQHKGLIRLINKFGIESPDPPEMASNIEALIAYAARHFSDEEQYIMRSAPELLAHQIECHSQFIELAYDFAARFQDGEGETLRAKVYDFLCSWLISHIREEDQQYNKARRG
jgi:hemerythrin